MLGGASPALHGFKITVTISDADIRPAAGEQGARRMRGHPMYLFSPRVYFADDVVY